MRCLFAPLEGDKKGKAFVWSKCCCLFLLSSLRSALVLGAGGVGVVCGPLGFQWGVLKNIHGAAILSLCFQNCRRACEKVRWCSLMAGRASPAHTVAGPRSSNDFFSSSIFRSRYGFASFSMASCIGKAAPLRNGARGAGATL